MIDWARVDELRFEIGSDSFAEVVDLFLDEVEGVVMRLKTQPNPARFESDLHFLKGGAWNLGFAEFGALCQDGERKAALGHRDGIDIPRIVDVYFTSRDIFLAGLTDRGRSGVFAA
ncbi:Hpt domain-containing protein [Defluviimonas sp. SAOS-178_SWC]|uniref:Hpt domain-containing protein n=1 Tax=Defluviimonas sp. SAOS-178_SWC TaxID=3121287 RepID=UPI0032218B6C